MKKAKQLFGKIISIMFALVLILTAIPSDTMTVYAEDAAVTNAVEKAIATNVAKDLYSSNYTTGSSLSSGVYYLSKDKTFGSTSSGTNGLKIASNATVYIYIPYGVTLTAIGGAGSGTTGGKAGILVPSGSKLVFLGEGTVVAKGGKGGDASGGGAGDPFPYSKSGEDLYVPAGGTGGNGGGGAGAGIGTNGGAGGSGAGSGGSGRWVDKDEGYNGYTGSNGNNGSSASATGTIYNVGVTINATGGASGSYGGGGSAGSAGYVTFSGSDTLRGAAGGAGGGGGGSGRPGAAIGTGGGGGGQGGGGGSAGYIWSGYYIGGGGGGAGAGNTSGDGGVRGSYDLFSTIDREKNIETYGSNGSSSSTTPGNGTTGYIKNKDKTTTTRATGGSGGYGGNAGAVSSTTTVQTSNLPTFPFKVTFEGARTTDNLNVQTYNYGATGTIVVPEYDGDASTCFLGWEVKTYGKYAASGVMLSEADATIYQPGETITIDPGFSGDVVLVARTAALQGVSATTETLVIEKEEMQEEVSYYTYQVNAYLDDVITDVGNLELRDELGNVYEIAYEDGVYSFITDANTEFSLYRNNADTGVKVTKNEVAELKLYTASVTTKLDGKESADMGIVSLKGEGAPSLSTFPDSGIYTAIGQLNNVHYSVFVDGINTNYTVSYGEALELNYYTTTLTLTGNLKPESVLLVANDGSGTIELYKIAEKKYSAFKLKHDLIYTLYIDGQMTTFTDVCFDKTNDFSVGYVKTIITTTLDGEAKEVGVVTLDDNQMMKEEDGLYSSKDIVYLDDSTNGNISVNDRVVTTTGLGNGTMISYYSVEYSSEHKLLGELPTDTTVYLSGDKVLLAPAVTAEDTAYEFIGWYVDGILYQPGDVVTVTDKKVVVTAAWEDKEFDIRYELGLDNAVNAPTNPEFYTIGGGDVLIENPTADGYIFDGWTYDEVYEPQKDFVISADARQHYELVANWTPKTYEIVSDMLDATDNLEGTISLNFGTRITGYSDLIVPNAQLVTITNTGNQTIMLNTPIFEADGANYFTIGVLSKTILAPFESATFVVQPKTGLATDVYEDIIEISCVSTEDSTIEGNSILFTTRFEVGRDTTAPEAAVTVGNGDVTHVSDQFIFEPEDTNWYSYATKPEITIEATDFESGVSKVEYYLSKKPLTFAESGGLESITNWKTYNESRKPTISDSGTGTYYLFVRVTDGDGNVSYISTEGLVVDIIAPSITFADGTSPEMYETYVGTQSVVIKDNHLVSVTVDGEEILPGPDSKFEFELKPSMGTEQVIIATDSFGHSTEIIIIVEPEEYTIHADLNGGTGSIDDWNVYEAESNILPFLPEDCVAPYGKELAGWAIGSVDSDIVIAPGAAYEFEGDTTIYAIWRNVTYTIDYILNGGTNAEGNPATFDKDTNTITLLDPKKEGYIFVGWTWEAGMGIGTEAQTTPVKDVVIAIGSIQNKCFIANWEKMTDVIDQMFDDVPDLNEVNSTNKELVSNTLDIIDKLLSDDNIGSLTEDEIADVKEKQAELKELLGQIEEIEEKLGDVDSVVQGTPDAEKVTSEDKEEIEDALEIIEDLLKDENKGNLTEEEQKTVEKQQADLKEKLEKIEAAEEKMKAVEDTANSLPPANGVTSEDKEEIEKTLNTIKDLLKDENKGNLTEEEQKTVEKQQADLKEKLEKIEAAEEKMEAVEDTANSLPPENGVTSEDKEEIEDALEIIEDLLKDENKGNLTEEEQKTVEKQQADLAEKLEKIEAAEEKLGAVEDTATTLPPANGVTSEDKEEIEDALEIIEDLLKDENKGNLTEEEQKTVEKQQADLKEKLEKIEAAEEKLGTVEETVKDLPSTNKVTSEDKEEIEDALEIIEDLLADENVGNLTADEKKAMEDQQADLKEKLEKIEAAEEKMEAVEDTANSLPPANGVTSEDKEEIEDALEIIEDLLKDENKGNLTEEEQKTVEKQQADLAEKLEKIEAAEEKLGAVEDTATTLPPANGVTSEDKEEIEDALEIIEDLLKDENKGNLTEEEQKTVEKQQADLKEKLEKIEAAEEKLGAVEETVKDLPSTNKVTSEDKEEIEDVLEIIEDLLADENVGNLTADEKKAMEDQQADLKEKLEKIEAAEEKMEAVEDTANSLPPANGVTSEDKEEIEDALEIIEDLLKDENKGNLTEEEQKTVEKQQADLAEKLENIVAAEEKLGAVEETVKDLPSTNKVTSEDKEEIEDALEIIDDLLAEENKGNLTEEEKTAVEEQKADLTEKLDIIQIVEDTLAEIQNKMDNIPSKDVITTESKDEVLELLDIITGLQENHPTNLTEEQIAAIAQSKEELQELKDRIQKIEDSLNKVENESAAQPDYEDITSDNKEDIKDIIEDIENILKDEKENLSSEEKEALEEKKKELEDKVTFIEQIEKYEPVAGDFENTTEPEINDNNGNLANDSQELIEIIPLEKTEKEHVAKGESVKVYLEVTDITETVTEEDKELIESELENEEVAVYLDLTLFKQIGNREPKKIPNTNGVVTITFQVPSDLINQDASVTRTYKIIRVHEGETTIIDAVFDELTGELTFETDKFSTYALIYDDAAVKAPQTGDASATWPWMLLMIGFSMIVFAGKAGSMNKR